MNPIIDNRIACNIEFAQTLVDFLNAIRFEKQVKCPSLPYLITSAENLLAYQRRTCTSTEEKDFFSRIGKPLIPMRVREAANIGDLVGKTIIGITGLEEGYDRIVFRLEDGTEYTMYHEQECCEDVFIDDVCGDVEDIINSTIYSAEETSSDASDVERGDRNISATWTFYHIRSTNGTVTIKWYGTSNGYYSESVSFYKEYDGYR